MCCPHKVGDGVLCMLGGVVVMGGFIMALPDIDTEGNQSAKVPLRVVGGLLVGFGTGLLPCVFVLCCKERQRLVAACKATVSRPLGNAAAEAANDGAPQQAILLNTEGDGGPSANAASPVSNPMADQGAQVQTGIDNRIQLSYDNLRWCSHTLGLCPPDSPMTIDEQSDDDMQGEAAAYAQIVPAAVPEIVIAVVRETSKQVRETRKQPPPPPNGCVVS